MNLIAGMTMSLDGLVTDSNGSVSQLYPDLEALRGTPYMNREIERTGAVLMGGRTFEMGDPDSCVGKYEFQVLIFVLTHEPPRTAPAGRASHVHVLRRPRVSLGHASRADGSSSSGSSWRGARRAPGSRPPRGRHAELEGMTRGLGTELLPNLDSIWSRVKTRPANATWSVGTCPHSPNPDRGIFGAKCRFKPAKRWKMPA